MPRKPKEPAPVKIVCDFCHKEVRTIEGRQLLSGRAATYRHVEPPLGCPKGDPLFEDEAH